MASNPDSARQKYGMVREAEKAGVVSPETLAMARGFKRLADKNDSTGEQGLATLVSLVADRTVEQDTEQYEARKTEEQAKQEHERRQRAEAARQRILADIDPSSPGKITSAGELATRLASETDLPENDDERERLMGRIKTQVTAQTQNEALTSTDDFNISASNARDKLQAYADAGFIEQSDVEGTMDAIFKEQAKRIKKLKDNLETLTKSEIEARKKQLTPDAQKEVDDAIKARQDAADKADEDAKKAKEKTQSDEHIQQIEDALDEDKTDVDLTEEQILKLIEEIKLPSTTKDRVENEKRLKEKYKQKLREKALETQAVKETIEQAIGKLPKLKKSERSSLSTGSDIIYDMPVYNQKVLFDAYAREFPGFNELSDIEKQVIIQEAQQRIQELEQIEGTEIGKNREASPTPLNQYEAIKKDIENLALPQDIRAILGSGVDALRNRDAALREQRKAELELAEAQKRKLTVDRNIHRLKRYWPIAAGTLIGFGLGMGGGLALGGATIPGAFYGGVLGSGGAIAGAALGSVPGVVQNLREGGVTGKEFEAKVRRFEAQLEEIKLKQTQDALNQYQEIERLTNEVLNSMGIDRKALQEVLPDFFGTRNLDQFSNIFEPKYYARPNAA